MLDILLPKVLGKEDTYKVRSYKGLGHIPKDLKGKADPSRRILLDRLPKLLQGYGKALSDYPAVVVVVCDLDDRCLKEFREALLAVLNTCHPAPRTCFCVAVEEGEAWLLGDLPAIRAAYPKVKNSVLKGYANDSICGTWEKLADALYPGGHKKLSAQRQEGTEKFKWAERITPYMDVDKNASPSFKYFRDKLRELGRTA